MRGRVALGWAVVGLLASTGCGGSGGGGGGGGGGPPPPPPEFEGPYHLGFFRAATTPSEVVASLWGIMTSDGIAAISTGVTDQNENGVLSNPSGALSGTFSIAADGTTSWLNLGVESLRGGTSEDRHAQVVANVRSGTAASSLAILLRRSGVFGSSSLSGRFRVCSFGTFGTSHIGSISNVIFDGAGGQTTRLVTQNTNGTVANPGTDSPGSYFVLIDGRMTLGGQLEGGILEGGEVILFNGTTTAAGPPFIAVAIKDAPAATNATFSGTYAAATIEFDVAAGRYRSLSATAVADGAGAMTVSGAVHSDGVVGVLPATNASYTVGVNGALLVGGQLGAVSADGVFATLGGSTTNGQNPTFTFFVRRGP